MYPVGIIGELSKAGKTILRKGINPKQESDINIYDKKSEVEMTIWLKDLH